MVARLGPVGERDGDRESLQGGNPRVAPCAGRLLNNSARTEYADQRVDLHPQVELSTACTLA